MPAIKLKRNYLVSGNICKTKHVPLLTNCHIRRAFKSFGHVNAWGGKEIMNTNRPTADHS